MKKLLSRLTVLLVLTAMLNISVAHHYYRGELVATKVSLNGALAGCCIEEENCPSDHDGDLLESHCCDDFLTSYNVDNSYTPGTKAAAELSGAKTTVPDLLFKSPVGFSVIKQLIWSDISPHALLMTSSVGLPNIRVLRI